MSGFEPTETQSGVGRDLFSLIDPEAIPYPETDSWSLNYAAETLRTGGQEMASITEDMETTWQGLQEHYSAPESETLFAAVGPVATTGQDLEGDLATVATALEDLAEAAEAARRTLNTLRIEAQSFHREHSDKDVWWLGHDDEADTLAIVENLRLKTDVNTAWATFTTAEVDCANAISTIYGGATFNSPEDATGAEGELVYGTPSVEGHMPELGANFATVHMGANSFAHWFAENVDPSRVDFDNSDGQAAWDTLVVGQIWGTASGVMNKSGLWHQEHGVGLTQYDRERNRELAGFDAAKDLAPLLGLYGQDGWLWDPRQDDASQNMSWDNWFGNLGGGWGQALEGHTAWSQREEDPQYTGTYSGINTFLLFGAAPIKLGTAFFGSGTDAGGMTGAETGDSTAPDSGPGSGTGGHSPLGPRGDRFRPEEADTPSPEDLSGPTRPITDRFDGAIEDIESPDFTPTPTGPDTSPPGPTPDPPRQDPAPSPTPPPGGTGGQGQGGESGGRSDSHGGDQPPRGDSDGQQPRPRDGDRQGREGTTPAPLTGGSDTPGEGSGSGTQGREGRGGNEDTTRPRGEEESPERPTGHRDDEDESQQEHRDGDQREHQDEEPSPTPEAGGGGGHDSGGGPPPTSGGDESPNGPSGNPERPLGGAFTDAQRFPDRLPDPEALRPTSATSPTAERLREDGLIGDGWENYQPKEENLAKVLRDNGVETTSVIESEVDGTKTPDSIINETSQTLEFKILDSFGKNSIKNNLRGARKQADNVALDIRGVEAAPDQVVERSFSAIREYGGDLNEVIIIGNGYVIIWP